MPPDMNLPAPAPAPHFTTPPSEELEAFLGPRPYFPKTRLFETFCPVPADGWRSLFAWRFIREACRTRHLIKRNQRIEELSPQHLRTLFPMNKDPEILEAWQRVGLQICDDLRMPAARCLFLEPKLFPRPEQVMGFEHFFLLHCLDALAADSELNVRRNLCLQLLMSSREATNICQMTVEFMESELDRPKEQKRALMEARLDRFIGRAQRALDPRAEIAGLKTLAIVQGLTIHKEDDPDREFINGVQQLEAETGEEVEEDFEDFAESKEFYGEGEDK